MTFALLLALVAAAPATEICPAECESLGYEDVYVSFGSGDFTGPPHRWLSDAWLGLEQPEGVSVAGPYYVSTISEIERRLLELSRTRPHGHCPRIRKLAISSHGENGRLFLADGGDAVSLGSWQRLAQFSCMSAAGAELVFVGCNAGRGCRGEDFMLEAARALLPRGGSVRAQNFYASPLLAFVGLPTSGDGIERRLEVGEGGAAPALSPASLPITPASQCSRYARDEYDELRAYGRAHPGCTLRATHQPVHAQVVALEAELTALEARYAAPALSGASGRLGLSADQRAAAQALRLYFDHVSSIRQAIAGGVDCPAGPECDMVDGPGGMHRCISPSSPRSAARPD